MSVLRRNGHEIAPNQGAETVPPHIGHIIGRLMRPRNREQSACERLSHDDCPSACSQHLLSPSSPYTNVQLHSAGTLCLSGFRSSLCFTAFTRRIAARQYVARYINRNSNRSRPCVFNPFPVAAQDRNWVGILIGLQ